MSEAERIQLLAKSAVEGGAAIQALQREYDEVGWRIQEPTWAKARHLLYHLLASTTELALLVEEVEHAEERGEATSSEEFNKMLAKHRGISANLLFHAAQIATLSGVEMGEELVRLHHTNAQRFAPESAFASLELD